MKFYILNYIAICFIIINGCSKEKLPTDPIVDLGGDRWAPGPLDNFIKEQFIKTYNIEIKYKWSPFEVNYNRTLVPPQENKVIPVLRAIRDIWMKPYEKVGGTNFLKLFSITKFVLVRSAEYNNNGTIVLGTAEGGTKVALYLVNDFELKEKPTVVQMLHTIHHEFAHILHQNIHYPQAWRGISTQWYTQTWINTDKQTANSQGFVSSYAKSAESEDFVETISFLLVEGQSAYDDLIKENKEMEKTFRLKERIVHQYYKDAFNIDFKSLQKEVQTALLALTKTETK